MFFCTNCHKEFENPANFCSECGGKIEEKIEVPIIYACSQCQKEYDANTNFCMVCGGKVVPKDTMPPVYACSQCQKEYDENTKFCSACGGKVEKSGLQTTTSSPVQQTYTPVSTGIAHAASKEEFFEGFFKNYKFAPTITLESATADTVVLSTTGSIIGCFSFTYVMKTTVTLNITSGSNGKMQAVISKQKTMPTIMGWFLLAITLPTLGGSLVLFIISWLGQLNSRKFAIEQQILWFNLLAPYMDCFTLPVNASFNLNGKNPAEIAAIAFKSFGRTNNPQRVCKFAGQLDMGQLQTAINSYADDVNPDEVICQIYPAGDNGSTGTLITTRGIYSKVKFGIIPVSDYTPYNEINIAGSWNSLICENYTKIFYWTNFTMTYAQVKEQLNYATNCMTEQRELMEFIRAMQCRKC